MLSQAIVGTEKNMQGTVRIDAVIRESERIKKLQAELGNTLSKYLLEKNEHHQYEAWHRLASYCDKPLNTLPEMAQFIACFRQAVKTLPPEPQGSWKGFKKKTSDELFAEYMRAYHGDIEKIAEALDFIVNTNRKSTKRQVTVLRHYLAQAEQVYFAKVHTSDFTFLSPGDLSIATFHKARIEELDAESPGLLNEKLQARIDNYGVNTLEEAKAIIDELEEKIASYQHHEIEFHLYRLALQETFLPRQVKVEDVDEKEKELENREEAHAEVQTQDPLSDRVAYVKFLMASLVIRHFLNSLLYIEKNYFFELSVKSKERYSAQEQLRKVTKSDVFHAIEDYYHYDNDYGYTPLLGNSSLVKSLAALIDDVKIDQHIIRKLISELNLILRGHLVGGYELSLMPPKGTKLVSQRLYIEEYNSYSFRYKVVNSQGLEKSGLITGEDIPELVGEFQPLSLTTLKSFLFDILSITNKRQHTSSVQIRGFEELEKKSDWSSYFRGDGYSDNYNWRLRLITLFELLVKKLNEINLQVERVLLPTPFNSEIERASQDAILLNLPLELQNAIFANLKESDRARLSMVCTDFYRNFPLPYGDEDLILGILGQLESMQPTAVTISQEKKEEKNTSVDEKPSLSDHVKEEDQVKAEVTSSHAEKPLPTPTLIPSIVPLPTFTPPTVDREHGGHTRGALGGTVGSLINENNESTPLLQVSRQPKKNRMRQIFSGLADFFKAPFHWFVCSDTGVDNSEFRRSIRGSTGMILRHSQRYSLVLPPSTDGSVTGAYSAVADTSQAEPVPAQPVSKTAGAPPSRDETTVEEDRRGLAI